jgi:integrase
VPITILLRDQLVEHKMATGREGDQLLFGRTSADASNGKVMQDRADDAWAKAGLNRITPHQCRHTFASLMIAAGVDAKALSTYMGHANIAVTLDLYGHLMPGSEAEAAGLLDTYLAAQLNTATEAGRGAGEVLTGAPAGARARETAYLSG